MSKGGTYGTPPAAELGEGGGANLWAVVMFTRKKGVRAFCFGKPGRPRKDAGGGKTRERLGRWRMGKVAWSQGTFKTGETYMEEGGVMAVCDEHHNQEEAQYGQNERRKAGATTASYFASTPIRELKMTLLSARGA